MGFDSDTDPKRNSNKYNRFWLCIRRVVTLSLEYMNRLFVKHFCCIMIYFFYLFFFWQKERLINGIFDFYWQIENVFLIAIKYLKWKIDSAITVIALFVEYSIMPLSIRFCFIRLNFREGNETRRETI